VIDTRDKRASVLGLSGPFVRVAPVPDGSIDAADRRHVAGLYRGDGIPTSPATFLLPISAGGVVYHVTGIA
jgi:hypothetical protein